MAIVLTIPCVRDPSPAIRNVLATFVAVDPEQFRAPRPFRGVRAIEGRMRLL
jgi:hypothetical protein